ncbi:MAG: hypothetical protein RLY71_1073 [Pseudomonadota bacterium]|jgi:membrane-associated phospholipid phosphatase
MVLACLTLVAQPAGAQPSLPYLPSLPARHALTLLVDDAGLALPLSSWPLPAAAVRRALAELPRSLPGEHERARAVVAAELDALGAGRLVLGLSRRADTLVGYGDDYAPASSLRLRGAVLGGAADGEGGDAALIGRFGLRLEADPGPVEQRRGGARARLDDSAIAVEALGVQLQVGTRSAWWGPGWRSSLILGNNTPSMATLSLQRASAGVSSSPWLSWMGPWSAEFFAGQVEGDAAPAYAWLVGQRLVMRPHAGWELGLSRTAQWGGRDRPQSGRNFVDMLFARGTNPTTAQGFANDPSNQLAGFDVRARCPAGWPCAVYTQWIGDDMAYGFPTHYLVQYGAEYWTNRSRHTLEYTDSACDSSPNDSRRDIGCAYFNHVYVNGYASAGRWIGASQGPDVRLLSWGWLDQADSTSLRLDLGLLSARPLAAPGHVPVAQSNAQNGRLYAFSAQRSYGWSGGELTPQLRWQRQTLGGSRLDSYAVGAQWSTTLGAASRPGRFDGSGAGAWLSEHPLLGGAALLAAAAAIDRPMDRYARDHGSNRSMLTWRRAGDALPVLALGVAAGQSVFERGTRAGDTALAAATAGVGAYAGSLVLKAAIARDRPTEDRGPRSFGQGRQPRRDSAMPSSHAAMALAVLTPYAQTYGQNGLYALAAVAGASRVLGREHWSSDVVAGSLLGYHVGRWTQAGLAGGSNLALSPGGIALSVPLP